MEILNAHVFLLMKASIVFAFETDLLHQTFAKKVSLFLINKSIV